VPLRSFEAQREESADGYQQQSPQVVVDVNAATGPATDDDVLEGTEAVMYRVGQQPDEGERDEEGRQETKRGAPAIVEMGLSHIVQTLAERSLPSRVGAVVASRHGGSLNAEMRRVEDPKPEADGVGAIA
jgi:hypothetical protein